MEGRKEGREEIQSDSSGGGRTICAVLFFLMRLHISSKNDICKRMRGIFAMGRTSGITKSNTIPSPRYEGREVQHNSGYGSAWTTIRCPPLEFGVTASGGSSSIS